MTMKMMILAAAGLMTLAGCSSGGQNEETLANNAEETNVVMSQKNDVAPPQPENLVEAPTPDIPPHITDDEQQVRDDADASGLTSRIPEEGTQPGQGGNEARPAE